MLFAPKHTSARRQFPVTNVTIPGNKTTLKDLLRILVKGNAFWKAGEALLSEKTGKCQHGCFKPIFLLFWHQQYLSRLHHQPAIYHFPAPALKPIQILSNRYRQLLRIR